MTWPTGVGATLALMVLVIVLVLCLTGGMQVWPLGVLLGMLAIARLT